MAALTSTRCLAGSKAFTGLRPRQASAVSNGVKVSMGRKDSYMVEVNVGDDEPEDIAVRKFMKKVMDSRVIEQLRARRYKETPLQEFKRRTKERIERIKNKVVEPTFEEEIGFTEPNPFADFFPDPDNQNAGFLSTMGYVDDLSNLSATGGYLTDAGANQAWGQYVGQSNARGYMQPTGQPMFYSQDVGGYADGSAGFQQPADQQPAQQ